MSVRGLGIVAGLSLALLLLALFDPWQDAPHRAGRLLVDPASTSSLTHLVLEDPSTRYELERQSDDSYQLTAPLRAPADASSVRQIVQAISLLRSRRQTDFDAVEDALDAPALVIEYRSGEETERLSIGDATGDGRHRWVGSSTSKKAHLVEAHLVDEILSARSKLLGKSVVPFAISRAKPLRIEGPASWLAFQDQRVWVSEYPTPMPAAARSKELYATLRAMRFHSVEPAGEACTPVRALRIEHGDQTATLEECGRCDDSRVQVAVDQRMGCFEVEPWNALVEAVAQPTSILDLELVPAQASGLALSCDQEVLRVDAAQVELARLREWSRQLNASVIGIVPGEPMAERCTLELSDDPGGQSIVFGRAGERWLAAPADRPYMLQLDPEVESLLEVSALHFASLDLITEDPLFARRIELKRPAWPAPLALVRDELGGSWSDPAGAIPSEQATALANAIRTRLAMLGAERYEKSTAPTKPAELVIDIDFDAALGEGVHSYSVRLWRDASGCMASVNQGPLARLSPELCEQLAAAVPR